MGLIYMLQNVEVEEERVDERSVEDLLTFINGGDGGTCEKCFSSSISIANAVLRL